VNESNTLVFSHEQDVDGIFSAAILKLAFGSPEIVLTNYGIENMLSVRDKIYSFIRAGGAPGTIIIADMGPNPESAGAVIDALQMASQNNWRCIWIDHHIWPEQEHAEIRKWCEVVLCNNGDKKCTAELCVDRFKSTDSLSLQLAAIARRTDFPDTTKFPIPPLTPLISYYVGLPELRGRLHSVILENITKGIFWNYAMQEDIIESARLIDESIERSVKSLAIRQFAIGNLMFGVAIVKADSFVSRSILLGRVMDQTEIDIAAAYTDDGKVSLRRKDVPNSEKASAIDCSKLAREFKEGGGHAGAAGGFLRIIPKDAPNGDSEAINEISSAVSSYLSMMQLERGAGQANEKVQDITGS
jgi:oligoribonuclease NrnB/cAMP/cGMP phosphodiesterase (DHH superfamily)